MLGESALCTLLPNYSQYFMSSKLKVIFLKLRFVNALYQFNDDTFFEHYNE